MSSDIRLSTVTHDAGGLTHSGQTAASAGIPIPPRHPSAISTPGFDAGTVIRTLRRYRFPIAVLGTMLGAAAAGGVWMLLPPAKQSAYTVLHISAQQPHLFAIAPEAQIDTVVYRQRQQAAVTSTKVLETALADTKVAALWIARMPNAVEELEKRVIVDFEQGTEFMRITVDADSLDESLILVTAIKNAYLSEVVNKERGIWEKTVGKREEVVAELEAQLNRNQEELARKLMPFNLRPADASFIPFLWKNAESTHQQKTSELRRVEFEIQKLTAEEKSEQGREGGKVAVLETAIIDELDRDPNFVALRAKTLELERTLADNERSVPRNSALPEIVKLRAEVEAARREEVDYRTSQRPRIEARLAERARNERKALAVFREREMNRLRGLEATLTEDIKQLSEQVMRLSSASHQIETISQTIARQEKQIAEDREMIARQRREIESAPSRVSEHEEPRVIPVNEVRRRLKYAGMAGVTGVGLVVALFAGRDILRNRVSDLGQVTGLTLPVLGALPTLDPPVPNVAARSMEGAVAAEAIDTVRTMILHAVSAKEPRVLLVSSASPGEGKTTLSGWLAASLARAGYHTLLVDGDLRRPSAHTNFHIPLGPGVADILRGQALLRECWHEVPGQALWVLPAGRAAATSSELLPKGGWRRLLQEARERFDFVVVDSSPVLSVVDPVLMAQACDGVLLAVLQDVSRVDLLADTANRLRALDIPVVGCVVHRAYRPPTDKYYSPAEQPSGQDPVLLTRGPPTVPE